MEQDKYPIYDHDRDCGGMTVAEPVGGLAYAVPQRVERAYHLPVGVPHTPEEAIADIEAGEREFEREMTFSHEELMQAVWNKIDGYAG